jgi:hypothetical protein
MNVDEELSNDAFFTSRRGSGGRNNDGGGGGSENYTNTISNNLEEVDLNSITTTPTQSAVVVQPSLHKVSPTTTNVNLNKQPVANNSTSSNSSSSRNSSGSESETMTSGGANLLAQHNYQQQLQQQQQMQQHFNHINHSNHSSLKQQQQHSQQNTNLYQQPQMLDNNALQRLLMDEAKSVLVIDDNEMLQVKSSQEFINMFKSSSSTSSSSSSSSASSPSASQSHPLHSSSQISLTPNGMF